jgi:hypothetical protein
MNSTGQAMSDKQVRLVFVIIFVLGILLRLYGLAAKSLWYDEGTSLIIANYVVKVFAANGPDYSNEPPLLVLLLSLWNGFIPYLYSGAATTWMSDFLIRLLPCFFGILGIPLSYLVFQSLFKDKLTALLGCYFFAISPFQIYYAQELRAYSLYACVSLAALYFMIGALREDQWRSWVGLIVFETMLMYVHFISVWNIAAMNLFFLVTIHAQWKHLRKWVLCQSVVFVLILPSLYYMLKVSATFEDIVVAWSVPPSPKLALISFVNFFAGYSPGHLYYRSLFLLAGGLFAAGLFSLRKRPKAMALVIIMGLLIIAGNIVVWRLRNFALYEHRLFIFSAIICYGCVAAGLRSLPRYLGLCALLLLSLLTLPCLADHYAHRLHASTTHRAGVRYKADLRAAARYVDSQLQPGDKVGHPSHYSLFPFFHYLDLEQHMLGFSYREVDGLLESYPNLVHWNNLGAVPVGMETFAEGTQRFCIVNSWWEPFEPPLEQIRYRQWCDAHFLRVAQRNFDGVTVFLYDANSDMDSEGTRYELEDDGRHDLPYVMPETVPSEPLQRELHNELLRALEFDTPSPDRNVFLKFDRPLVQGESATLSGETLSLTFYEGNRLTSTESGFDSALNKTLWVGEDAYTLLHADSPLKQAVFAAIPAEASGPFRYRFTVGNPGEETRHLQCRVFEAARLIDAIAFDREEPTSSAWTIDLMYNPTAPDRPYNRSVMAAHFNASNAGQHSSIERDVQLAAGDYTLFAKVIQEIRPANESRAAASFHLSPAGGNALKETLLNVDMLPWASEGERGWTWMRVGHFESTGDLLRLTVSAGHTLALSESHFDFARIAIVAGQVRDFTPEISEIRLEPLEELMITRSGAMDRVDRKQIEVELLDAERAEFRTISFEVRHPGATAAIRSQAAL